jgi:hypothetical protein
VSPGNGGWDRSVSLPSNGLDVSDPSPGSGVASQTFSLDGGPFVPLQQVPGYDIGDGDLPIPDGTHTLAYRVTDNAGNVTAGSQTYTVDSTPPNVTCSAQTPAVWPTDGSMVDVGAAVSVSDALSGPAGFTLAGIRSNVGSGDPVADGEASGWDVGTADTQGQVAALPGRVYTLFYDGQDVAGNEAGCAVQITVPGASGPALLSGDLTLSDGTPLQVDVQRDATGLIGGTGVTFGSEQSTSIDDAELLGPNGYIEGTFNDGLGFQLLLHDGDELRLIRSDGFDTGWVVPASGKILVTQDTTPPVMTLPSGVAADATSPAGATVSYTVTATDDFDPHPSVWCAPASGSLFPIGDTTVHCTATDASGNASHGSFTVHVKGAGEQLADLLQRVVQQKLGPGFSLPAKLRAALAQLAPAHPRVTCLVLGALSNELRAQTGKKISATDAASLEADLARIENVLGC